MNKTEKIDIIDMIIEMYPDLQRDRILLIDTVLGVIKRPNKYILERFDYENNIYYLDKTGIILDKYLNFKGCYIYQDNKIKVFMNNNKRKDYNEYIKNMTNLFYSN